MKRATLCLLSISLLLAAVWGWFYWGWRSEQNAIAAFAANVPHVEVRPIGPPWLRAHLGAPGFVLDRTTSLSVTEVPLFSAPPSAILTDLSPVDRLPELESLTVDFTSVSDLTSLSRLKNLRHLSLQGSRRLKDLSPLSHLSNLEAFTISGPVVDLTPLAGLGHLKKLYLSDTDVADLAPLSHLSKLELLFLDQTKVTDLRPLASLLELQGLLLNGTKVTDIAPLSGLTKLRVLGLSGTSVHDFSPLEKMTSLELLQLSRTPATPQQIETLRKTLPKCRIDKN